MSVGSMVYRSEGLKGITELYEEFPHRLYHDIIVKNARIYRELYNMLTEKEKEILHNNTPQYMVIDNYDDDIDKMIKEIKRIKEDYKMTKKKFGNSDEDKRNYKENTKNIKKEIEYTMEKKALLKIRERESLMFRC